LLTNTDAIVVVDLRRPLKFILAVSYFKSNITKNTAQLAWVKYSTEKRRNSYADVREIRQGRYFLIPIYSVHLYIGQQSKYISPKTDDKKNSSTISVHGTAALLWNRRHCIDEF